MKFVFADKCDYEKTWSIINDAGVDVGSIRSEVYDANGRGSTRTREWRVDGYEVEMEASETMVSKYFAVSTYGTPAKAMAAAKAYARAWKEE